MSDPQEALPDASRPRAGVSACLLGHEVRYDGGHRNMSHVSRDLARHVDLEPLCPEVELGLGTPREPIALFRSGTGMRLLGVNSAEDHTAAMEIWCRSRAQDWIERGITAAILKGRSPSCGLKTVPIHGEGGSLQGLGSGFWVQALQRQGGILLVEAESLEDDSIRHEFLCRLFLRHRIALQRSRPCQRALFQEWLSREELLIWTLCAGAWAECADLVTALHADPVEQHRDEMLRALSGLLGTMGGCDRIEESTAHWCIFRGFPDRMDAVTQALLYWCRNGSITADEEGWEGRGDTALQLRQQSILNPWPGCTGSK